MPLSRADRDRPAVCYVRLARTSPTGHYRADENDTAWAKIVFHACLTFVILTKDGPRWTLHAQSHTSSCARACVDFIQSHGATHFNGRLGSNHSTRYMYLEQGAADCQPSFSMTKEIKIINDCTQLKIHSRICDSIFFFEDRIGYTEMELIKN